MKTDVNNPMFDTVQPGRPGWFYTREPREETLRRLVRMENGELWIASGPMPVRLDGADLEVVGPVPPWQADINDQAQIADDGRRAELAAENMILGEQVRSLKSAMLALLQGQGEK